MHSPLQPELVVVSRFFGRQDRARRAVIGAAVALVTILAVAAPAGAQAADLPTVGSKLIAERQFVGLPKADGVVVRSGPSTGDLAVTTLRTGQEVIVVDMKGQFLRVLPPSGTFCLVPKARVNVRGAADQFPQLGRVSDDLNVRVGSTVNAAVGSTTLRMTAGDTVRVIGEKDNYYKIEPPKLVFFYVAMSEMKKGREVAVNETGAGWSIGELPSVATTPAATPTTSEPTTPTPTPTVDDAVAEAPLIEPETGEAVATTDEPEMVEPQVEETAPVEAKPSPIVEAFTALDARYESEVQKPLSEQPLAELLSAYVDLQAQANADPDPTAKGLLPIIDARVKTITIRQSALADLEAIRTMRSEVSERHLALEAEREELAERAERGRVTVYEAVGEVQPSSLQLRGATLFRLCDPETKRTVVYLKADGDLAKTLAGRIESFVGVSGEVVHDTVLDLKYVVVAKADSVDPEEVFGQVAAKLIPPSMVAADTGPQASAQ